MQVERPCIANAGGTSVSNMVMLYRTIIPSVIAGGDQETCTAIEFQSTTIRDETGPGTRKIQELNITS